MISLETNQPKTISKLWSTSLEDSLMKTKTLLTLMMTKKKNSLTKPDRKKTGLMMRAPMLGTRVTRIALTPWRLTTIRLRILKWRIKSVKKLYQEFMTTWKDGPIPLMTRLLLSLGLLKRRRRTCLKRSLMQPSGLKARSPSRHLKLSEEAVFNAKEVENKFKPV